MVWALTLGASAVFLLAASFKTFDRRGLAATVESLGTPKRAAPAVAAAIAGAEVVLFVVLAGLGPRWFAAFVVGVAGLVMLTVGGIALGRGLEIRCACFSRSSVAILGWRQVWVGTGLLALSYVVLNSAPMNITGEAFAARVLIAASVVVLTHTLMSSRQIRLLVRYRRAADKFIGLVP